MSSQYVQLSDRDLEILDDALATRERVLLSFMSATAFTHKGEKFHKAKADMREVSKLRDRIHQERLVRKSATIEEKTQ